jgi:pimeloyl-ACP methyl ester carboxylesterase
MAAMYCYVTLGTRRLAYLEGGQPDGRAVVWLHAFPLTARMYTDQLAAAPPGWRVLAPDLAGLGASDDHEQDAADLHDYARDVVALLDALGIDRAVVGGVSLGGYVTLAVARLAPQRLLGVILADTKAPADSVDAREGRARMLEIVRDTGPTGVAGEMLGKLLGESTRRERPSIVEQVRAMIQSNRADGIRRAVLRLRDRPDATPGLATLSAPALVLVGAEDAITPLADAEQLAAAIPRASLEVVPAAGHLANLENPGPFNAAVAAFLARVA